MKRKIKYLFIISAIAVFATVCVRTPIGDRILAKACILGVSKIGECQLAK